jgi:hypothetical protein
LRSIKETFPELEGLPIGEIIQHPSYQEYLKKHPKYKINMQQMMKEVPVLDCLHAGDGWWVQHDLTSLEPTIIAEMSGDPTYYEIYASGKPHDVYLYTAIRIMSWVGDKINAIYNIESPTKESVAEAKKTFKPDRGIAKTIFLSGAYKAGPKKQYNTLKLQGVKILFEAVKEMNYRFWNEMFITVKKWEEELLKEVDWNGRYVLNGMGRPFVVLKHKRKDIMNTIGQSTGHCVLDIANLYLSRLVLERNLNCRCIVEDWHDERIWWAPTREDAEDLKKAIEDSLTMLNESLNPEIPFKGDVEICKTFTEFKGPDPWTLC